MALIHGLPRASLERHVLSGVVIWQALMGQACLTSFTLPESDSNQADAGTDGGNQADASDRPAMPRSFTQLSSGDDHACAVDSDGQIWCWGENIAQQLGNPSAASHEDSRILVASDVQWSQVSAGGAHTCAIDTDERIHCWGSNERGQLGTGNEQNAEVPTQIASEEPWVEIRSGTSHTCAIAKSGSLWCWGNNRSGEVGPSAELVARTPVRVDGATDWTQVAVGSHHTCALKRNGSLWCWGQGTEGQLGLSDQENKSAPTRLGTNAWNAVAAGGFHTCGIQSDGTIWCWGQGVEAQLGLGDQITSALAPARVGDSDQWDQISAGRFHTCAIARDRRTWCWGDNFRGNVGIGTTELVFEPTPVGPVRSEAGATEPAEWIAVDGGALFTCAIDADSDIVCWGNNRSGQLGVGDSGLRRARDVPTEVAGGPWASASLGFGHSCGVRADGSLFCWGSSVECAIGARSETDITSPLQIGDETTWRRVRAGIGFACATQDDGSLWCWGGNGFGRLGASFPQLDSCEPLRVVDQANDFSLGGQHACLLQAPSSPNLRCWGDNRSGQLGIGNTQNAGSPRAVTGTWSHVSSGLTQTCGVRDDGRLACWGRSERGALGSGTTADMSTTPQIVGDRTWSSVSVGFEHACGITEGALYCWGRQFGAAENDDDDPHIEPNPIPIGADSDWTDVSAGARHSCGLRATGRAFCWGNNDFGQLGVGDRVPRLVPVQVSNLDDVESISAGNSTTCARTMENRLFCWGNNFFGELATGETGRDADRTTPTKQPRSS